MLLGPLSNVRLGCHRALRDVHIAVDRHAMVFAIRGIGNQTGGQDDGHHGLHLLKVTTSSGDQSVELSAGETTAWRGKSSLLIAMLQRFNIAVS